MYLEKEGYEVRFFETTDHLHQAAMYKKCNLIIIDTDAPGTDGFAICAQIKQQHNIPAIVLTGQESEKHYVFGKTKSLDAYFTKPLSNEKLITHINALFSKIKIREATTNEKPDLRRVRRHSS